MRRPVLLSRGHDLWYLIYLDSHTTWRQSSGCSREWETDVPGESRQRVRVRGHSTCNERECLVSLATRYQQSLKVLKRAKEVGWSMPSPGAVITRRWTVSRRWSLGWWQKRLSCWAWGKRTRRQARPHTQAIADATPTRPLILRSGPANAAWPARGRCGRGHVWAVLAPHQAAHEGQSAVCLTGFQKNFADECSQVAKYLSPEKFLQWQEEGEVRQFFLPSWPVVVRVRARFPMGDSEASTHSPQDLGFKYVASGPMVRSSYKAGGTRCGSKLVCQMPVFTVLFLSEFFLENLLRERATEGTHKV